MHTCMHVLAFLVEEPFKRLLHLNWKKVDMDFFWVTKRAELKEKYSDESGQNFDFFGK